MGQVEKPRFGHGRTSEQCYKNFLKNMNFLNMVTHRNESLPSNPLMQVKTFSLFQSKFSLWLAKVLSWGRVKLGLQGRVKLGNSLFSCEIIMSGLMKPTEKFVPFYILAKNKKMFQRVVIAFPWDYPTNYMLWSPKDRVTEGQNSTFSKIFSLQFKLTHITRQK